MYFHTLLVFNKFNKTVIEREINLHLTTVRGFNELSTIRQ